MKEMRLTQTQQVINTLREQGGYATLGNLYHLVDASTWATKTPNESIRRIVNGGSPIHTNLLSFIRNGCPHLRRHPIAFRFVPMKKGYLKTFLPFRITMPLYWAFTFWPARL